MRIASRAATGIPDATPDSQARDLASGSQGLSRSSTLGRELKAFYLGPFSNCLEFRVRVQGLGIGRRVWGFWVQGLEWDLHF